METCGCCGESVNAGYNTCKSCGAQKGMSGMAALGMFVCVFFGILTGLSFFGEGNYGYKLGFGGIAALGLLIAMRSPQAWFVPKRG